MTGKIPYLRSRLGAGNRTLYYWIKGKQSVALGENLSTAETKARALNDDAARLRSEAASVDGEGGRAMRDLVRKYRASRFYLQLAPNTQDFYRWHFNLLEKWADDWPVAMLKHSDVQDLYQSHCDAGHPNKAISVIKTLQVLLKYAKRLGWVSENVADKPGLRQPPRHEAVVLWSDAMIEAFVVAADSLGRRAIGTAVMINSWMGQREADILRLPAAAVSAPRTDIKQRKTGACVRLSVRTVPHLCRRIDEELARRPANIASAVFILTPRQRPYDRHNFSRWVRKIAIAAADSAARDGQSDLAADLLAARFCWLRHSAVTRLAESGATLPEIAEVTGHKIRSVDEIIAHYLINKGELAENAFRRRMTADGLIADDKSA